MTDLLTSQAFPAFLVLLAFAAWWRAGNMTVKLTWEAKTTEPEPSKAQLADIAEQRAENKARRDKEKTP